MGESVKRRVKNVFLIVCIFLTFACAGCGGNAAGEIEGAGSTGAKSDGNFGEGNPDESSPSQQADAGVSYMAEFQNVPGADEVDAYEVTFDHDKMYYATWEWDEEMEREHRVMSVDMLTGETWEVPCGLPKEASYMVLATGEDGTLAVLWSSGPTPLEEDRPVYFELLLLNSDGEELLRRDVTEYIYPSIEIPDGASNSGIYNSFYSYNDWQMALDREENIYIYMFDIFSYSQKDLVVFDKQGEFRFAVDMDPVAGLLRGEDGFVYAFWKKPVIGEYRGISVLQRIDVEAGDGAEEYVEAPEGAFFYCAGESEFWLLREDSLYCFDAKKQAEQRIVTLTDYGIPSHNVQGFTRLTDGRIVVVYNKGIGTISQFEMACFSEQSQSEGKTVLTLGVKSENVGTYEQMVLKFNRENPDCVMQLRAYDGDEGLQRLNSEILSGQAPDILDMDLEQVSSYMAKGVFADLYAFIDQDPDMEREDFIPNILRYYEQNGKLYGIVPEYAIETLVASQADVGQRTSWTVDEVRKLLASKPEGTYLITWVNRSDVLKNLLQLGADAYIDWGTGECGFDNDEFAGLLEFAALFPEQAVWQEDKPEQIVKNGQQILYDAHLYNWIDVEEMPLIFDGPVNYIGYPAGSGQSGSYIDPCFSLGITEGSRHKDEAWRFVRYFLGEEYQNGEDIELKPFWVFFPIRESSLLKQFHAFMTQEIPFYHYAKLTEEDLEQVRALIDTAQAAPPVPLAIRQIVDEEAGAFFAGQRTAREAAANIQNRVQLYVYENR